jgi:hypothetical protein
VNVQVDAAKWKGGIGHPIEYNRAPRTRLNSAPIEEMRLR